MASESGAWASMEVSGGDDHAEPLLAEVSRQYRCFRAALVTAVIVGVAIVFIVLFSAIFHGADVFDALSVSSNVVYASLMASCGLLLALYLLDSYHWTGVGVPLRYAVLATHFPPFPRALANCSAGALGARAS